MGIRNKSKYAGEKWIGKKYNYLTVAGCAYKDQTGCFSWPMVCDCGNVLNARISNVVNGHTMSCGCHKQKMIKAPRKHGMAGTRLYRIWQMMLRRCRSGNTASKYYADRGIVVCDEWKDFETFEKWAFNNGYNDTLSIERVDVNGNYCPENCKWIERRLQSRNTRLTYWVDYKGKRMSLTEASEMSGLPYKTVFARVTQLGWDVESALSIQVNKTRSLKMCERPYNHV